MKQRLACSVVTILFLMGSPCFAQDQVPNAFELRSMPGFRLLGPSYRASGDGMTVSVSVCRVIGWAAASPSSVHFLRAGSGEEAIRHHDVRIGRMGFRGGENCERVATHFPGPPRPREKITICLAYSHRRCE